MTTMPRHLRVGDIVAFRIGVCQPKDAPNAIGLVLTKISMVQFGIIESGDVVNLMLLVLDIDESRFGTFPDVQGHYGRGRSWSTVSRNEGGCLRGEYGEQILIDSTPETERLAAAIVASAVMHGALDGDGDVRYLSPIEGTWEDAGIQDVRHMRDRVALIDKHEHLFAHLSAALKMGALK